MKKELRLLLMGISCFFLIWALGLIFEKTWATGIWVWPETPHLGLTFVAAMMAGIVGPTAWIALSGELAALRGAALDITVMAGGTGIYLLMNLSADPAYKIFSAIFILSAIFGIFIFFYTRDHKYKVKKAAPKVLKPIFAVWAVVLFIIGLVLVFFIPHIFPLDLTKDMSVVYGWFFLGSAMYFTYGFLYPKWSNAKGQLLSFFLYDLFLILPYTQYLKNVSDANRMGLYAYLAIVYTSLIICIYFLFINKGTKLTKKDFRFEK